MKNVVIVGGGSAGLSAALVLGRSLRTVTVIDEGNPRNSPTEGAHNLLGREGINPLQLLATAQYEISQLPSVDIIHAKAQSVKKLPQGFQVTLEDGREIVGEKLLLATGIIDKLPSIPGMEEFWGKNIFHCPLCHGYEVRNEPLAVYSTNPLEAYDLALLIHNWSKNLTLLTDGNKVLTDQQIRILKKLSINVVEQPIARIQGKSGEYLTIEFANGNHFTVHGLFLKSKLEQRASFAHDLGCEITELGLIKVDTFQKTTVPGVYAAGDMTTMFQQVSYSIAQGSMAGAKINHELIEQLKQTLQQHASLLSDQQGTY